MLVGTGTGTRWRARRGGVAGAEVLALEKRSVVGGSTGHSGGVAWVPNNHCMAAEGILDSRENALRYCNKLAMQQADDVLLEAFVDGAPEMLRFVEDHSPLTFRVSTIMGDNADYHPEWPGAVQKGRSVEPIVERQGLLGPELIEGFRQGFVDAGGEVLTDTPVRRLIVAADESGARRSWASRPSATGRPFRVRARRGVHLAAGASSTTSR